MKFIKNNSFTVFCCIILLITILTVIEIYISFINYEKETTIFRPNDQVSSCLFDYSTSYVLNREFDPITNKHYSIISWPKDTM